MRAHIDPARTWYVATYRNRPFRPAIESAMIVMRDIHDLGMHWYLPRARHERWSSRGHTYTLIERPAMPPYFFVGMERGDRRFGRIRDLDGVGGLVGIDGEPVPVPASAVEAILIAETNLVFDDTRESRRKKQHELDDAFPIGSQVELVRDLDSVLSLLRGEVLGTNGRDRVRVAFGRLTSWVSRDEIRAA